MSGMSVTDVSAAGYYQNQAAAGRPDTQNEQESLVEALKKKREEQPTLVEMMKQAREKAEEREKRFQLPKNGQRYGDATVTAYTKLARARSTEEVDAASSYARRQIAQFRAAKRSDSDNAERIQAAINQLQKAVNRAKRKKRELSQEKVIAKRQARLEKEKRTREARRLRHQLKDRRTLRAHRESSYIQEALTDNQFQDRLQASRMEVQGRIQEMSASVQVSAEAAAQQYAAVVSSITAAPAPAPEISVEA